MMRFVGGGRVDVLTDRQNLRRFGVPVGGPFDPLVGDVLDRLLPGSGTLLILECSGADATFQIEQPASVAYWSCAKGGRERFQPGDTFRLPVRSGLRGWIGVRQDHPERTLVTRMLSQGESIEALDAPIPGRTIDPAWLPKAPRIIQYLPNERRNLGSLHLTVDMRMDRKGIQLSGSLEQHNLELPSAPTTPGSLQWTPSGSLLLLGPDGPTIGGYPSIGTIPYMEFSKVAQLCPMDSVDLLPISLDQFLQAERSWTSLWSERLEWLSKF